MSRILLGVLALAILAGCGESNDTSTSEISRHRYPDDGVTCWVYNSHDDSGSGISCVDTDTTK